MRGRSPRGSSTPTSKPIELHRWIFVALGIVLVPLAAFYVIAAFTADNPWLRIGLRTLPVLPIAVWTIWFDSARPFQRRSAVIQAAGRLLLLIGILAFALALLGLGLNWLYDPNRVI